jgi:hypothetical protein
MNSDPISAISGTYSGDSIKRFSASIREEKVDLSKVEPSSSGAYLKNEKPVLDDGATSSMNIGNLRTVVSDGLDNGFTRRQLDVLSAKLLDSSRPGSLITQGELKKDMMMVADRISVAESFSKMANKFSDSVMTVVKS